MSLMDSVGSLILPDMAAQCTMLDHVTVNVPDGQGGLKNRYADGAKFTATLVKLSSSDVRVAERQGLAEQYNVIVPRGLALKKGDVLKRDSDGLTFRCTSNTRDSEAPNMSAVQIAVCGAERWDVPDDQYSQSTV